METSQLKTLKTADEALIVCQLSTNNKLQELARSVVCRPMNKHNTEPSSPKPCRHLYQQPPCQIGEKSSKQSGMGLRGLDFLPVASPPLPSGQVSGRHNALALRSVAIPASPPVTSPPSYKLHLRCVAIPSHQPTNMKHYYWPAQNCGWWAMQKVLEIQHVGQPELKAVGDAEGAQPGSASHCHQPAFLPREHPRLRHRRVHHTTGSTASHVVLRGCCCQGCKGASAQDAQRWEAGEAGRNVRDASAVLQI